MKYQNLLKKEFLVFGKKPNTNNIYPYPYMYIFLDEIWIHSKIGYKGLI